MVFGSHRDRGCDYLLTHPTLRLARPDLGLLRARRRHTGLRNHAQANARGHTLLTHHRTHNI